MEAPKCSLCEKRHYGSCNEPQIPSEPRVRKAAKSLRPKKKPKPAELGVPAMLDILDGRSDEAKSLASIGGLADRVDELELIVISLVEGRRKRTQYMKEYMRNFRRRKK